MKNYIIFIVLIIVSVSCNDPRQYMEAHQQNPAGESFYTFKGKIVGQDSLRWDIDLNGDKEPEIFVSKGFQRHLLIQLNDSVYGDNLEGDNYVIRSNKHNL